MEEYSPSGIEQQYTNKNFRDTVLERQNQWRSLKKKPFEALSQAIDLPAALNERIFTAALDNLPPYIAKSSRQKIEHTHPSPIISVGVLVDERGYALQAATPDVEYPAKFDTDEKRVAWEAGIKLLDEIATDTLAIDIEHTMKLKKNAKNPLEELDSYTVNLIQQKGWTPYADGLKSIDTIFGGREQLDTFRRALTIASLSGDRTEINEMLQAYGYKDIDDFALDLGGKTAYVEGGSSDNHFVDRLKRSTNRGTLIQHSGIINLPYGIASLSSVATGLSGLSLIGANNISDAAIQLGIVAINGYLAVRPVLGARHTTLHEICHYLSEDSNKQGLLNLKNA